MAELKRVFLSWDRPLFAAAIERLESVSDLPSRRKRKDSKSDSKGAVKETSKGQTWDLSGLTIVVPTKRTSRRFLQRLANRAQQLQRTLVAPTVVTVGQLPELVYTPRQPLASEMQQTLAWTQALLASSDDELRPLVPQNIPREPLAPWVELASLLRRIRDDLAADDVTPAKVAQVVDSELQKRRWELIETLTGRYWKVLDSVQLSDPYRERKSALDGGKCQVDGRLIVLGCVDLGNLACRVLQAVASDTEIWIGAPEPIAERFDPCGRVVPHRWAENYIEVDDTNLISAGDAFEQSASAVAALQRWHKENNELRSIVGITDDQFAPLLETDLNLAGWSPFLSAGESLRYASTGRLLSLISDLLAAPTWSSLAALIRHADVLSAFVVEHSFELLNAIDGYRANHFPDRWEQAVPRYLSQSEQGKLLASVRDEIRQWLAPLSHGSNTFGQWCTLILAVLQDLDARQNNLATQHQAPDSINDKRLLTRTRTYEVISGLATIPTSLDVEVTAQAAIEMLLQRLAEPRLLAHPDEDAIEIAGWLELATDDSPALALVGLNHPFVPQAVTADPFLPGSLRTQLGMSDNDRRFARDAYVLQVIQKTRPYCALVVGRTGPDASPTLPSRLLASCSADRVLERVEKLIQQPPAPPQFVSRWDRTSQQTDLPLPTAVLPTLVRSISVTAFRDYLQCPFRYYLRHVLRLRPMDDSSSELAANQFGDLVHAAVEGFGLSADRDATDPNTIANIMIEHLHQYAETHFGSSPPAAVRVQITQAEKRLQHVAQHQSARAREGWTIHAVEAEVNEKSNVRIEIDGDHCLLLKGRVDRIDYHSETGRWAILDYKTHGHKPLEKHFEESRQRWIDLQLPLYLLMLKALGIKAEQDLVQLGYFNIAEKHADSGVNIAEFTPGMIAEAHLLAKQVVAGILAGEFSPQLDADEVLYDDYGMILQTGIAQNVFDDFERESAE